MNAKSVNAGIVKLREKCVEEEKIKDLATTEDLLFSSSSAAAGLCLAIASVGREYGKIRMVNP